MSEWNKMHTGAQDPAFCFKDRRIPQELKEQFGIA